MFLLFRSIVKFCSTNRLFIDIRDVIKVVSMRDVIHVVDMRCDVQVIDKVILK